MIDVVALGELLIDFAAKSADAGGYPTMAANPGGAPGNFLAALGVYGCKTAFIGKVGADTFGRLLRRTMQHAGIETKGIVEDPEVFTTLAFVTFDASGDRSFSFARKPGADTQLRWDEVNLHLIDEARVFHFGTLSLTDEPARSTTQQAVAYAKAKGKLITCDPNLREPLWKTPAAAKEQMLWSLTQSDVVKISDIFGGSAVARLLELGKAPEQLTQDDLSYIGSYALTAASLSTEHSGGIPSIPSKEAVLAAMQTGART